MQIRMHQPSQSDLATVPHDSLHTLNSPQKHMSRQWHTALNDHMSIDTLSDLTPLDAHPST